MKIQSLEALTGQDPTTSRFGPFGLSLGGPILSRDASLQWVQDIVAPYDLDVRVPEDVRAYYEVSRRLHVYGFFEYRFFTIASERATFGAEFAVRRRLVDSYQGHVPIERGEGSALESASIDASDPWSFESQFRRARREKPAWQLAGHPAFNGSFQSHLTWAQLATELGPYFAPAREPVTVEESRGRLDTLRRLRNLAAHPSLDTVVTPADSSRAIEFTWRFINALWGIPAE